MTLAALMLRDEIFARAFPRLKYATLGVLFVNVSIGGTLTPFAAPPVLMVAAKWDWDHCLPVLGHGLEGGDGVLINAALITLAFRREFARIPAAAPDEAAAARCRGRSSPSTAILAAVVFTQP